MGVIVGRNETPDILMGFLDRYRQQMAAKQQAEEQKRQFDATLGLDQRRTKAYEDVSGAQVRTADYGINSGRANDVMAGIEKIAAKLQNDPPALTRYANAVMAHFPDNAEVKARMAPYLTQRETMPADVAEQNQGIIARDTTGRVRDGKGSAQDWGMAYNLITKQNPAEHQYTDALAGAEGPEEHKKYARRATGDLTTAEMDQRAATSIKTTGMNNATQLQIGREGNASSEKIATARTNATGSKVDFSQEHTLRSDYLKETKNWPDIKDSMARILASSKDASGQSDVALLFAFMKLNDPGSVVRESEQALILSAGSLYDKAQVLAAKVARGDKLSPGQRAQIVGAAQRLYEGVAPRMAGIDKKYTAIANRYGLEPSAILNGPEDGGGEYTYVPGKGLVKQ